MTETFFQALEDSEISNGNLVESLQSLQGQKFSTEDGFWEAVQAKIGKEQTAKHKEFILKHALHSEDIKRTLLAVILGIVVLCWLELNFAPGIFKVSLGYSMPVRILISIIMLAPLGLLMGMPFPLGITLTNRVAQPLIPWVWGINGYATVIGSVLCVIFAISFGFKMVIFIACGIYLVGLATIMAVKE